MTTKHSALCEAPICANDPNPNFMDEVIWHPSEKVCLFSPLTKWQKKQNKINKNIERYSREEGYTANQLENLI